MPSVSGKTGYWWSVTTVKERRHVPRVISIWCCCIHITFFMQYLPWVSSQNVLFSARLGFFFPTARHLWFCQCPATEKKCQQCQGSSAGKPFMGFLHSLSYSYLESASPNNVALWYHIHEPPTWYCTHEPGTATACSCLLCYHKMFKNLVTNVLMCVCTCMHMCVFMFMQEHICTTGWHGGQRTATTVCPCLPPCLRQSLFAVRNTHLASGDSPAFLPPTVYRNTGITYVCTTILLYVGSEDPNSCLHAHTASTLPMGPSP